MIKKIFLLIFLFPFFINAQNITIKGIAKSFDGEKIKLNVYSDQISYKEKTLNSAIIEKGGSFTLTANIKEIIFSFIEIGNLRGSLYLQPNKTYEIVFPSKDSITKEGDNMLNSMLPFDVYLSIMNQDSTDINFQIQRFDMFYNEFISKHKSNFIFFTPKNKPVVDSLKSKIKRKFNKYESDYLSAYIEYRVAGLEIMNGLGSKNRIAKQYFAKRPVLYENIEYMYFFNQFFTKYFTNIAFDKQWENLLTEVNYNKSYTGLNRVLSFDSLLSYNDTLREFILLKGLYDSYYDPSFNKESVVDVIKALAKQSIILKDVEIANTMSNYLELLKPQSKSPEFTLFDINKKQVSLSDFKGKFVYLCFWTSWSVPALQEIQLFNNLKKEFGKDVEFIGVNADKQISNFENNSIKYKFEWTNLYYASQSEVLEAYNIKAYPTFIFIDRDGNIYNPLVKKPSESFRDYLITVLDKEAQRKKLEDDKKKKGEKDNIFH